MYLSGVSSEGSQKTDSLRNVLSVQSGKKKVNTLNRLSWELMYSDTRLALQYAQLAYSEARTARYHRGEYVADNLIGIAYDVLSKYDSALIHYHAAYNGSLQVLDTQSIASNLTNIALAHWHTGNLKEALEYNFAAFPFFEKLKKADDLAALNNNIGLIYADMKSWQKAMEFYRKAYTLHKKSGNKTGLGATINNMGKLYYHQKNYPLAKAYIDSAIVLKTSIQDKYGLAIAYKDLGMLYSAMGDQSGALALIEQSIGFAEAVDDKNEAAVSSLEMALIYLQTGQAEKALALTDKAERIAREINSLKLHYQAYENYALIFEKQGNLRKALDYYRLFRATRDSVISDQRLNQVYELEMKHQAEKSADKIALLTQQQELHELQISRRNTLILGFAVLFIATLILIWFYYQNIRHKQQNVLDKALFEVRERKAREVIEAEIRERRRIGEELHDGLGQILSVIKLRLTNMSEKYEAQAGPNIPGYNDLVTLVDHAFGELRHISHNMAPLMLREQGLVVALRNLLERTRQTKNYKVLFDSAGIDHRLDPFIENTVYRITQEILNNMIKHAEASEINLQVISDGNELTLVAEDNGIGFEIEKALNHKGIGLKNIYSRTENLNGNVLIDSAPGRGTIITIIIPLRNTVNAK